MRSALDVARNPQPYQIPLYYPPFPSVINNQPKKSGLDFKVASALRNYQNINNAELKRLKGDLTAYRQEAQTVFHQNVAYPRATVDVGDAVVPPEAVIAEPSDTDLYRSAGGGSPTDVSDFEGLTSGGSIGRGAGGGKFKKVTFGLGYLDLTEPESDFAPRASQSQRKKRRTKVYVDNATNRKLGRVGVSY